MTGRERRAGLRSRLSSPWFWIAAGVCVYVVSLWLPMGHIHGGGGPEGMCADRLSAQKMEQPDWGGGAAEVARVSLAHSAFPAGWQCTWTRADGSRLQLDPPWTGTFIAGICLATGTALFLMRRRR